jgi:hypothetical protein
VTLRTPPRSCLQYRQNSVTASLASSRPKVRVLSRLCFLLAASLTRRSCTELKELALEVSTDPDHKFDLAIQLDDLDTALALARSSPHLGSQSKWRTVGDRALASWKVGLAEECFKMANDLSALLLIYTSTGDREGLAKLAELAGKSPSTWARLSLFALNLTCSITRSLQRSQQHRLRLFPAAGHPDDLCRSTPVNRSRARSRLVRPHVRT